MFPGSTPISIKMKKRQANNFYTENLNLQTVFVVIKMINVVSPVNPRAIQTSG